MKNIVIFGGSFNPIHKAHIATANVISNLYDVWMMPVKSHAFNKEMIDFDHRFNMCEIAVKNNKNNKITVSDYLKTFESRSTYELLNELSSKYQDVNFMFAIGQDCADQIESWHFYTELLRKYTAIVIERKGYSANKSWYLDNKHIFLNLDCKSISSTEIRKNNKDINFMMENLDLNVFQYIQEHKLYE
jgi:nicotinate-nucleotide adenylyltransferase